MPRLTQERGGPLGRSSVAVGLMGVCLVMGSCQPSSEGVRPAVRAAIVAVAETPVALVWAEAKATADCMKRAGFEYPPYAVFQPVSETTGSFGGFAPKLTVTWAELHGYEGRISMREDPRLDPGAATDAYLATLTEGERDRYRATLNDEGSPLVTLKLPDGTEVGAYSAGCVAEGRKAVYGSVRAYLRLFYYPQQVARFGEEALADGSVRDALSRYAACMRDAGYEVESPSEAADLAEQRFGGTRSVGSEPSDEERAMAVADARCQEASRFHEALDAALVRAASGWLKDHEGEILALADLQRDALARAEEILGT